MKRRSFLNFSRMVSEDTFVAKAWRETKATRKIVGMIFILVKVGLAICFESDLSGFEFMRAIYPSCVTR